MPVLELLGMAIGEFIVIVIFHNTGALLFRIFTFGKIKIPFFGVGSYKEKPVIKYGAISYISGILFYVLIFIILVFHNTLLPNGN